MGKATWVTGVCGLLASLSLCCGESEADPEGTTSDAAVSDAGKPGAGKASARQAQQAADAGKPTQAKPTQMQARPAADAAAPSSKPMTPAAAPSSHDDGADAGSGLPDTGHGHGGSTQSDGKLSAFIEISDVPSGAEAHRCVVVELPNTEPVWAATLHASLTNGSHHMIVDRREAQAELVTDAELCSPSVGGDATRLMIAQQHETKLELPKGVGYLLEPKQRIYLQMHYINVSAQPITIKGTLELTLFPKDAQPIAAKSVFTGATSITLPAHQAGQSSYFQVIPADPAWHVFAMTSHTHQLGVHSTIERVAAADAPETKPLHESHDWAEPPLSMFEEPLLFKGDDGLRLTCRYMNTTDHDVHFGTAVKDEMCFMWIYYFVDQPKK